MATLAAHGITSTDTRPHPYSIAGSYGVSPTYERHGGDTRPSFANSSPASAPASAPPLSSFRPMPPHLATRVVSANRTRPRKPFWRLLTPRSFGCIGSPHAGEDHCERIDAHSIEPVVDVADDNFRQSFFDGMSEVESRKSLKRTSSKRTRPVADTSPKPTRSWSASRNHLTPSPMVEPLQNGRPYHYQKRSTISPHNGTTGEPAPDDKTLEVTKRRAGAFDIATRAIESASYIPTSPGDISTPGSSGSSSLPAIDDLDSISSGSIYSRIYSPDLPAHRAILSTKDLDDSSEQRAPQEDAFKQPLLKRSGPFDNDELPTPPFTPLRSRMASFSRPTPQVYPYLLCQASARQDSSQQVPPQSPTCIDVPLKARPAPHPAPSSPLALPNRNPKRMPSDSGHGPLIHTTLNPPFPKEGQDQADMFTPGPSTVVLKQPALLPSSRQRKPLTTTGKRF